MLEDWELSLEKKPSNDDLFTWDGCNPVKHLGRLVLQSVTAKNSEVQEMWVYQNFLKTGNTN